MRWLAKTKGVRTGPDYTSLWTWSVEQPAEFWASIWEYFDVLGERGTGPIISGSRMPDIGWFTNFRVNYARNALRAAITDPDRTALIHRSEAGHSGTVSYGQLDQQVAALRAALVELGVGLGDRVAAYLPNSPQALIGLLATASLGAIWTSCSPDFGVTAVVDRFAQVAPKVLIAVDGYVYNGKSFDRRPEVSRSLRPCGGIRGVVPPGSTARPRSRDHGRLHRSRTGFWEHLAAGPELGQWDRSCRREARAGVGGLQDRIHRGSFRPPALGFVFLGNHRTT